MSKVELRYNIERRDSESLPILRRYTMLKTTKKCTLCAIEKSITKFGKNGYYSRCKECENHRRKTNSRTPSGIITGTYSSQKQNSIKRGHAQPTYTRDELYRWVISHKDFKSLYDAWTESAYLTKLKPSIDRKDDYKGYSFDNIRLVTHEDNLNKSYEDRHFGINTKASKAVVQFTKKGEYIDTYFSPKKAEAVTGIRDSSISKVCKGIRKSAGGFTWKYKGDKDGRSS